MAADADEGNDTRLGAAGGQPVPPGLALIGFCCSGVAFCIGIVTERVGGPGGGVCFAPACESNSMNGFSVDLPVCGAG